MNNEEHKELSAEETMERHDFDDIALVMQHSMKGGSIPACCTCDARVEPDGKCPHSHPSILLKKGMI